MLGSVSIRPSTASRPVAERDRAAESSARAGESDVSAPQDRVTISDEARARGQDGARVGRDGRGTQDGKDAAGPGQKKQLTPEQQRQVAWLQQRDVHVRQHEAAHQAAGGSLTGGATFSFQVGADGRSYAVGGEVPVRLASGRTPDETIANARQARRAALSPSDPSGADLGVAAAATELEQAAIRKKAQLAAKAYGKQAKRSADRGADGETDPKVDEASGSSYPGSGEQTLATTEVPGDPVQRAA